MMRSMRLVVLAASLFACSSTEKPAAGQDAAPPAPAVDGGAGVSASITWHASIQPLMEQHCVSCHVEGGIAPFVLNAYESAKRNAGAVAGAVEAKRMPPWMPDPSCRRYQHERILPEADRQTILEWVKAGAPEGDPSQAPRKPQTASVERPKPTLVLNMKEAYTPDSSHPDDYRCFPLDHVFEKETYLAVVDVTPGQRSLVHHVITYLVEPAGVAAMEELDARDPGPGYTCFGGPRAGSNRNLGGWVPGYTQGAINTKAAQVIPAGSRIVMQVHYNTLTAKPAPDNTSVDLYLLDLPPEVELRTEPLANLGIQIEAGDANSKQVQKFYNDGSKPIRIAGVTPHMHQLGRELRVNVRRKDGGSTCLVDIPKWNFAWQQNYRFLPGEEVEVMPGDYMELECIYDNSAANQPVVNGERQPPRKVIWGEGTADEMCLNYIVTARPYEKKQGPEPVCKDFNQCFDSCDDGASVCSLVCASRSGPGCPRCVLTGLITCVQHDCSESGGPLITCIQNCSRNEAQEDCIENECGPLMPAFDKCVTPILKAGKCDSATAVCPAKLSTLQPTK
ncbi:MAG: hypothetical protein GMKNLPBB_00873 [Myxococcota bacterium]|nr:hypothetical protein [Myxococcota bacterium]